MLEGEGSQAASVRSDLPLSLCNPNVPVKQLIQDARVDECEMPRIETQDEDLSESHVSKGDVWVEIANAIRQGPSLPRIEPMKFNGDPIEFTAFEVNFRECVEDHVKDDSQRLSHPLAQCVGKARDAIRGCVTLPSGTKYSEAWKVLRRNFGKNYMITDACLVPC